MHRLLFLKCAILTYTQITQLIPLVKTLPLHNHEQVVGNIGILNVYMCVCLYIMLLYETVLYV